MANLSSTEIINNPTEIECHNCHWKWKVKDGGDDLFICHKCNYDNSKFYTFTDVLSEKEMLLSVVIGIGLVVLSFYLFKKAYTIWKK